MRSFIVDLSIRSDDIPELCLPEGITPGNIGKWWIDCATKNGTVGTYVTTVSVSVKVGHLEIDRSLFFV